jgi:hypothetical protein
MQVVLIMDYAELLSSERIQSLHFSVTRIGHDGCRFNYAQHFEVVVDELRYSFTHSLPQH